MEHFFLPKNGSVKRKADADIDTGKKPAKARKFDGTYLDLGFTSVVIRGETRPQCVVCGAILANESMKPAKLRRHLETKHGELIGKSRDFFARKLQVISQQKSTVQNIASTPASALKASYDVAYLLAKNKKPFTDAEKVVLPAAIAMCRRMGAESVADKLKMIPLSDTTISRRVSEMADNITAQLITQLQTSLFALQLDEATDISREAHLIAYVRYCGATTILEDFLFCKAIKTRATASELFDILNDFMSSHCLRWEACVGICTDGAPSMCGDRSGLKAKVLAVAPHVVWTHCIIHREALAARNMDNELSDVLSSAVKIVNAIKAQPTRARLFAILCAEMGSEHDGLLFHTEVRWLSRGRVLQRVFELRNEVRQFLLDVDTGKANHLCDPRWLVLLAYLADIFDKLNTLNMSLQGANANSFTMNKKVFAFKRKLDLWKRTIGAGVAVQFPLLAEAIEETEYNLLHVLEPITSHLTTLRSSFDKYFPEENAGINDWVMQPFLAEEVVHLPFDALEELIEVQSDTILQSEFRNIAVGDFWLKVILEYPTLARSAIQSLLPFGSSYLCEIGFSALAVLKTKYRTRLEVEDNLRVAVSKIKPHIDSLSAERQAHPSH